MFSQWSQYPVHSALPAFGVFSVKLLWIIKLGLGVRDNAEKTPTALDNFLSNL